MPRRPPLDLATTLRNDVYIVTGGRPMQWGMVDDLWVRHPNTSSSTLSAAIVRAIDKGWMLGEGEPANSVCLTDDGRRLAG